MNILFTFKPHILMLMKLLHTPPPIVSIIDPRMVNIFWRRSPISFKYIFFWCLFLDSYLTTNNSNIGVQTMTMMDLGTSALEHDHMLDTKC